jgi:hypothetical protein
MQCIKVIEPTIQLCSALKHQNRPEIIGSGRFWSVRGTSKIEIK